MFPVNSGMFIIFSSFKKILRCITTDGKFAATGSTDGVIRFWCLDAEAGHEQVFTIQNAHTEEVTTIEISATGKLMASGSSSGTIHTWNLEKKAASVFHF